jgi:hypothetical protein
MLPPNALRWSQTVVCKVVLQPPAQQSHSHHMCADVSALWADVHSNSDKQGSFSKAGLC